MKTRILLAVALQLFLLPVAPVAAAKRDARWKEVEEAVDKGLDRKSTRLNSSHG